MNMYRMQQNMIFIASLKDDFPKFLISLSSKVK